MTVRPFNESAFFNHRVVAGVAIGGCAIATAAYVYLRQHAMSVDASQQEESALVESVRGARERTSDAPAAQKHATLVSGAPTVLAANVGNADSAANTANATNVDECGDGGEKDAAEDASLRQRIMVALPTDDILTDFKSEAESALEEGRLPQALDLLRKHLYRQTPDAETLLDVGRIANEIGEYALSEQALLDAQAIDPVDAEVSVELARVYLSLAEPEKARFAARQAIRLDGGSVDAWNAAGRAAMSMSQWQRAEVAFRHAVELDPTRPMLHNNLGLLYIHLKDGASAVDALETAVELLEEDVPPFVYNNLGLAHELAGHDREALVAFQAALAVNPMYSRARVNLERLRVSEDGFGDPSASETEHANADDDSRFAGSSDDASDEGSDDFGFGAPLSDDEAAAMMPLDEDDFIDEEDAPTEATTPDDASADDEVWPLSDSRPSDKAGSAHPPTDELETSLDGSPSHG